MADNTHPALRHAKGKQIRENHWGKGICHQQFLPVAKVGCIAQFKLRHMFDEDAWTSEIQRKGRQPVDGALTLSHNRLGFQLRHISYTSNMHLTWSRQLPGFESGLFWPGAPMPALLTNTSTCLCFSSTYMANFSASPSCDRSTRQTSQLAAPLALQL